MKKNMGSIDRVVRVALAVVIAILYWGDVISGTFTIVLGFVALVFLATSFIGFCPLYVPLKISTTKYNLTK